MGDDVRPRARTAFSCAEPSGYSGGMGSGRNSGPARCAYISAALVIAPIVYLLARFPIHPAPGIGGPGQGDEALASSRRLFSICWAYSDH